MGNAYNTSAQMRERFRVRRKENKRKIEEARTQYLERQELKGYSDDALENMMDVLYDSIVFVDDHPFMDKHYFLDDITDIRNHIKNVLMQPNNKIFCERVSELEKMLASIDTTVSKSVDEDKIKLYLKKSIPALYTKYLNRVKGNFGDDIYRKIS